MKEEDYKTIALGILVECCGSDWLHENHSVVVGKLCAHIGMLKIENETLKRQETAIISTDAGKIIIHLQEENKKLRAILIVAHTKYRHLVDDPDWFDSAVKCLNESAQPEHNEQPKSSESFPYDGTK